ncbi:MAG: radical SAM protein [Spirochaetota bacterium]|nr:radical SAM protein [Spirochaetota bacterium]
MAGKFSSYLQDPKISEKWFKIKQFFFLKESTYDMTNKCNLDCEGCYYYAGDKSLVENQTDPENWRQMFQAEKARGITFVVLAGAEPALVPELCRVAYEEIPHGAIATNGLKTIPKDINYKIHISVWGDDEYSETYRKVKACLHKQLTAYKNDDRAVYIYTFTRENIDQVDEVAKQIVNAGGLLSFNQFSAPVNYLGDLKLDRYARDKMKDKTLNLMDKYKSSILYSSYNAEIHSHDKSLHELFSCPYPRMNNKNKVVGLGKTFRQYRSDLTWDSSVACCVPDTDCGDCRHYAAGSAIVTSKLLSHVETKESFSNWLDYVDTYLSVWVYGYEKSENLISSSKNKEIIV